MHMMHAIWFVGHIIGFFHQPSVIVISVMTIVGIVVILIFFKVFEKDFFNDSGDD
jgi:maltodextrin utilization protein YvdJ